MHYWKLDESDVWVEYAGAQLCSHVRFYSTSRLCFNSTEVHWELHLLSTSSTLYWKNLILILSDLVFRASKVRNKGPKDIMAVEELNGEVKFSTHLPYPNNLSRSAEIIFTETISLFYWAVCLLWGQISFFMVLCYSNLNGTQNSPEHVNCGCC